MNQFSYSFTVSMAHSIWQMAVLLLFYFMLSAVLKKAHPYFKRNILFGLLFLQLCTSLVTFLFYFSNPFDGFTNKIFHIFSAVLVNQSWIYWYAKYFFYGYSLIVSYKIAALLYNCISFKKHYSKYLVKPPVEIKMFTILKSFQLGIKRNVNIWYSSKVFTPLTFGFLKPVILMPIAIMNSLTIKETEALIIHELTHIKNNDYLLNWLLLLTETIYFFNPFVKIISKKIKLEREKNCDTSVIQFNYSSITYAETLLKIARQTQHYNRFQLAAVINKFQLLQRIHFFSNESNQHFSKKNNSLFAVILMLGIFVLNIFTLTQIKNNDKPVASFIPIKAAPYTVANELKENFNTATLIPVAKEKAKPENIKRPQFKLLASHKNIKPAILVETITAPENYSVMPVLLKLQDPVISKEVLVNEENSSGKTVTQAYKVRLKNGQWIVEPLWRTTEIKADKDSLKQKGDTLYHLIDPVQ